MPEQDNFVSPTSSHEREREWHLFREIRSQTLTVMPHRARVDETIRLLGLRLERPAFRREAWRVLEGLREVAADNHDGETLLRIDEILRRVVSLHGADTFRPGRRPSQDLMRAVYRGFLERPQTPALIHVMGGRVVRVPIQQQQQQLQQLQQPQQQRQQQQLRQLQQLQQQVLQLLQQQPDGTAE